MQARPPGEPDNLPGIAGHPETYHWSYVSDGDDRQRWSFTVV